MADLNLDRIASLKDGFLTEAELRSIYGLKNIHGWIDSFGFTEEKKGWVKNGLINRVRLEKQLFDYGFESLKIAAIRFGMSELSLTKVMSKIGYEILLPQYSIDFGVIKKESVRIFSKIAYPPDEIAANQTSYVNRLHRILNKKLGTSIKPVTCKFSESVHKNNAAYLFDVVTDEPLSLKYKIDLNFKKLVANDPDGCSPTTFKKYFKLLRPHILGSYVPIHIQKILSEI